MKSFVSASLGWNENQFSSRSSLAEIKYKRSFTLLETIVAIYVLLLGLVSAIALSSQSLSIALTFKQSLVATNLAQEGIELVRNKRDSNYLANRSGCADPCNPNTFNMDNLARGGNPADFCDKRHPIPNDPTNNPRGCYINWRDMNDAEDLTMLNFAQCGVPSGDCQSLAKDPVTGFYAYPPAGWGWEPTGFDRRIFIMYPAPLDPSLSATTRTVGLEDALVRVYVTWIDKFSGSRHILLETALTANLL